MHLQLVIMFTNDFFVKKVLLKLIVRIFSFSALLLKQVRFLVFIFNFNSTENYQVPAMCSVLILELEVPG